MKKLLTTLALLTAFTTPVFAQSFDPDTGTGNVLSFAHTPTASHVHNLARRSGLHSFALGPRPPSALNSDSPANAGGGSVGYTEMLRSF